MTKTHLVIPDQHAHPDHHNDRADWLGKLILDLKPDVVVNIGDAADLPSLSTYDKGKASFYARNYEKDITAHLDFQDRMWYPMFKSKKKLPRRVVIEGNHEHRIKRLLDIDSHLAGGKYGVSFNDLAFSDYYQDVVEYDGGSPGIIGIDGIDYSHYFVSGISGRPLQSIHHAFDLTTKRFASSTCGHSHLFDHHVRRDSSGSQRHGLVCGVYQDFKSPWAGPINNAWNAGICIKRGVDNGRYDIEWVSIERMKELYGGKI